MCSVNERSIVCIRVFTQRSRYEVRGKIFCVCTLFNVTVLFSEMEVESRLKQYRTFKAIPSLIENLALSNLIFHKP